MINQGRYNEIESYAMEWAKKNLGDSFIFREHQMDAIVTIINSILLNTKTTVVESPTGSGKSLIGIISAGVLAEKYKKSSYILISDTTLFKQYESDIHKYNLNWGCLEGKDNYTCLINGQPWSNSICQMKNLSLRKMTYLSTGDKEYDQFPCVKSCKYIKEYMKARLSKVSIMTYQYFLSTYTTNKDTFSWDERTNMRDVVFCDEAHKLPAIIKTLFSPHISIKYMGYIDILKKLADKNGSYLNVAPLSKFQIVFDTMKNICISDTYKKDERLKREKMLYAFNEYVKVLNTYNDLVSDILSPHPIIKANEYSIKKAASRWMQDMTVAREYSSILSSLGSDFCITSLTDNNETIQYNCSREPDMVKTFFHNRVGNEVLMSATIGNVDVYREIIGSDKEPSFNAYEIKSTFDFTKSPIYYSTRNRLSFKEKDKNLPNVVKEIEEICNSHLQDRILVQTGSYQFSEYLYKNASPAVRSRFLFHNSSDEKKDAILKYESYRGKVLLSPSMIEGWDGKDDKCRVIIIMKVPYASLADMLIKDKMRLYPDWYTYNTINKIVQGIGRGVRSETDYCTTYIVDGCFADLLNRSRKIFPDNILDRLKKF